MQFKENLCALWTRLICPHVSLSENLNPWSLPMPHCWRECLRELFPLVMSRWHQARWTCLWMLAWMLTRGVKHSEWWMVEERRATWLQSIYRDSLSLSLGDLHGPSPVPAGAAGARGPSERWGRPWPVGQPLLGAPVCYKWWWGALQHPGSPVHAKEPNCSGSWPAPRLPHLLFCPASLPLPLTSVFFFCPSCETYLREGRGFSEGDTA